jgi:ATP-dependent DNA helicase PIF1
MNFNKEQKFAYEKMTGGSSVFLTGVAGVGKSYVIQEFCRSFGCRQNTPRHSRKKINIGLTSTTGTSALLIGGTTLHSFLGIGLGSASEDSLVSKIRSRRFLKLRWMELDVLIIDEVSMLSADLFDKLNNVAQRVRHNVKPFGGIQLIVSGDFLQLPVVKSTKLTFEAVHWHECLPLTINLIENIRQKNDNTYREILRRVRVGDVTAHILNQLNARVGRDVSRHGIKPTRLYPLNYQVDSLNEDSLDELFEENEKLEFIEYSMKIKQLEGKTVTKLYVLNSIKKNCIATESLQICVGAQVMLLCNKIPVGLANGSRGVVVDFNDQSIPLVKFTTGITIPVEYHQWSCEHKSGAVTSVFEITQIPLKVAFAISIHKSQGVSLDCCEIDINECFCPGQAYVALSRVKSLDGLSLLSPCTNQNFIVDKRCIEFYNNLSKKEQVVPKKKQRLLRQ